MKRMKLANSSITGKLIRLVAAWPSGCTPRSGRTNPRMANISDPHTRTVTGTTMPATAKTPLNVAGCSSGTGPTGWRSDASEVASDGRTGSRPRANGHSQAAGRITLRRPRAWDNGPARRNRGINSSP